MLFFYTTIEKFKPKYVLDFSLNPKESYQQVEIGHPITPLNLLFFVASSPIK